MTDARATASRDLDALCRQANRQAAGWSAPADARSATPRRAFPLKAVAGAAGGLLGMAALAVQLQWVQWVPLVAGPEATTVQPPVPAAATPLQAEAVATSGAPAAAAWHGDELELAFDAMPLPQAAASLAQATGSHVSGLEALPATAVNLRLRTRDVRAAWQRLLQGQPGVALACDGTGCRVWIGAASHTAAPAGAAPPTPATPTPTAVPAAAGETESQPGGSC